jgi:hypothetical protein
MDKQNNKKEVKIIPSKDSFYLYVLNQIKQGKTPSDICLSLNCSKQRLNHYIRHLKEQGFIKKVGYGVWEQVKEYTIGNQTIHKIRGHGFVFKLKIPKIPNWNNRIIFLKSNNIEFKDFKKYQRILIKNNNIWLSDKSITIYFKQGNSFMGNNAEESEKKAINELMSIITSLENLFSISLMINREYRFTTSRKHFARINDTLAKRCNGTKTKIYLRLQDGVFLIDNSYNYNEAETQGNSSKEYMDKVYLKFLDDLFKFGYTAQDIHNLYELQKMYAENINKHMNVLNELDSKMEDVLRMNSTNNNWFEDL